MSASEIVNKVWNYAHVLRDDGVGYGDYVEQITYLIFLKMADEREKGGVPSPQSSPSGRGGNGVPREFAWARLVKLDGDADSIRAWEIQYRHTLESLGKEGGMLGTIFRKAQNKIDAVHPWPAPFGLHSQSKLVPDKFVKTQPSSNV